MKVKYSPILSLRKTTITIPSLDVIEIDGEPYDFVDDIARGCVAWPNIAETTKGAIIEAHVEDGELCLTVLRRYTGSRPQWDNGQHHKVAEGEAL